MKQITLIVCLVILSVSNALPYPYRPYRAWRLVRSPYTQNTFMLSSLNPPSSYMPENFMTSFGGGEAIATNDYSDNEKFENEADVLTQEQNPEAQLDQKPIFEEPASTEIAPSKKTFDKKDEEDDDDDNSWPFSKDPRRSYNAFFPIVIGGSGYPNSRGGIGRSSDELPTGSATAIANSFSTGRGGVASSHATSFGDPYLSMLLRNALFKKRNLGDKVE